jgi:hypothetical protein
MMRGRHGTNNGGAAAAAALAAVTLLALLQLAAPQATGRPVVTSADLTGAERAYLKDPAVAALRNPTLEPLAARTLAKFDALPAARAETAARQAGLTTDRLRQTLVDSAASLHLDPNSGALRFGCSLHGGADAGGGGVSARSDGGGDHPQPAGGGRRRELKGLDGITPPDQLDPDVSQAFLLHR